MLGKEQGSGSGLSLLVTMVPHHLSSEGDLHEGIHEVLTVTHKCFGDICHDTGVHFGQPFRFVESHIESGPGSL